MEQRGDGIKAQHIPAILKFISEYNGKKKSSVPITTIWGYEEPETGIELSRCFEFSKEFLEYSKEIQMFITTHSPAFYSLEEKKERVSINYVQKDNAGKTISEKELKQTDIHEKIGLMPLITPFILEKEKELEQLENILNDYRLRDKPILFVEDTYTQLYKVAWLKINDIDFSLSNFDEIFETYAGFYIYGKGNKDNLQGFLNNPTMNEWKGKTIIGLFDFDDAYDNYQKLKEKWEIKSTNEETGLYKKRTGCDIYAIMLPIPTFRKNIAGADQAVKKLEIELLLPDKKIQEIYGNSDYATEKIIEGLEIPKINNKNDFWKKILGLNKADFNAFQPLFTTINTIFQIKEYAIN